MKIIRFIRESSLKLLGDINVNHEEDPEEAFLNISALVKYLGNRIENLADIGEDRVAYAKNLNELGYKKYLYEAREFISEGFGSIKELAEKIKRKIKDYKLKFPEESLGSFKPYLVSYEKRCNIILYRNMEKNKSTSS